jgi:adenylyl cyclase-associated protein
MEAPNSPGPTGLVRRIELTSIIRRLEAATSRLEDMASSVAEPPTTNGTSHTKSEHADSAAATPKPAPPPKPVAEPLPQVIEDFDTFLENAVKKYVKISGEIGGAVAEQVYMTPGSVYDKFLT